MLWLVGHEKQGDTKNGSDSAATELPMIASARLLCLQSVLEQVVSDTVRGQPVVGLEVEVPFGSVDEVVFTPWEDVAPGRSWLWTHARFVE